MDSDELERGIRRTVRLLCEERYADVVDTCRGRMTTAQIRSAVQSLAARRDCYRLAVPHSPITTWTRSGPLPAFMGGGWWAHADLTVLNRPDETARVELTMWQDEDGVTRVSLDGLRDPALDFGGLELPMIGVARRPGAPLPDLNELPPCRIPGVPDDLETSPAAAA